MQPWIKKTLFALLGASLLAGSLSACSSGHGWRHGEMDGQRMTEMRGKALERVGSKLALDAAQKQKLEQLADTLQAQRKAFLGDAAKPREALQALVAGATFDRAGAQALVEAKVRAVQAGSPEVIAAMGDFYDSLRPEQQNQVREMMAKRRGWMGRRGGRHGARAPQPARPDARPARNRPLLVPRRAAAARGVARSRLGPPL